MLLLLLFPLIITVGQKPMKLAVVSYYEQDGGVPIPTDDANNKKKKDESDKKNDDDANKNKDNCKFNNPATELMCKKKRNCFICSLSYTIKKEWSAGGAL